MHTASDICVLPRDAYCLGMHITLDICNLPRGAYCLGMHSCGNQNRTCDLLKSADFKKQARPTFEEFSIHIHIYWVVYISIYIHMYSRLPVFRLPSSFPVFRFPVFPSSRLPSSRLPVFPSIAYCMVPPTPGHCTVLPLGNRP